MKDQATHIHQSSDLGTCKRCKQEPATTDYNGHGHYVCDHCDKMLNNEFDEDYR